MLNKCTIVIKTQWNPNVCNCYTEDRKPIKENYFDIRHMIFERPHFQNIACYKVTKHYISWILSCLLIYISNINKINKISLLTLVDYCVSFCICIY